MMIYLMLLQKMIVDKDIESLEHAIVKQLLKQDLEDVLHTLSLRREKALKLRFSLDDGQPKTLEEIDHYFVVTQKRIRQIKAKAMHKLRQPTRNNILWKYLEVKTHSI